MPDWGEVLAELQESAAGNEGLPNFDAIRRKYLARLHALTRRPVILYYSDWLAGSPPAAAMTLEDVQGFMQTVRDLQAGDLDLLLHLPGGSPEATARIVDYLRAKFTGEVRIFVPLAAMSAGTMLALAGDKIVMGRHSQLGPIDPQIFQEGQGRYVPSRAIVEQFDRACEAIKADPASLAAWMPILQQYGTSLLIECEKAERLALRLVRRWLRMYMFKKLPDVKQKAEHVARWFADYEEHPSHALGIDRDSARSQGVVIEDLEADQDLQDAVLSVHHATLHTFQGPAVKIIENNNGKAFIKMEQQIVLPTSPQ